MGQRTNGGGLTPGPSPSGEIGDRQVGLREAMTKLYEMREAARESTDEATD